ncbi:MAG: serine/threonine-protein kinase [Pseudomonadota bacterium]
MGDDDQLTRPLPDGPPGELPVGAELNGGQYKIIRNIAAGGFGITYLAKDNLDRDVALKECFPLGLVARSSSRSVSAASESTAASFSTARNLFLREARLLAGLSHPHVVHVQTLFEENGTAYMAMDFIHGHDLQEVINAQKESLTPETVLKLARELISGLTYLHESGLLHRDIKPSNIRIDRFGRPILIDFGAARQQVRAETRKMGTFRVVSDGYSPSEFYTTGAEQSPSSDLYSLAATLYHAIAGEAPPAADVRIQNVATAEPDPYQALSGRFADHDQALLSLIDRSMAISQKERPQSAKAWLDKLDAAVTRALPPDLASTPSPVPASSATGSGGFLRGALLSGVGVAVLAGAAYMLLGSGGMSAEEAGTLQTDLSAANARIVDLEGLVESLSDQQIQLDQARVDLAAAEQQRDQALVDLASAERSGGTTIPAGCPNFDARAARIVALTGSFLQSNAPSYRLSAGGDAALADCPNATGRGYVSEAPNISVLLSEIASNDGLVEFSVTAECDTTLLVNSPTTIWYFDDDSNGNLQPRLMIPNIEAFNAEEAARLDVWVGTFVQDETCDATLQIQGLASR